VSGGESRLAEVPEAKADGLVAEVYDEIRRVTGVPTVAFVYRALAVEPEELAAAWADLAPNLSHPGVRASAARLDGSRAGRAARLPDAVVSVDRSAAAATLAAFDRLNRLNLVGLTALLDGVDAPGARAPATDAADPIAGGLPMADLDALPRATIALLERMSVPVSGPTRPILIPSLYRYFAADHALLAALWEAIRPVAESGALERAAAALRTEAGVLARTLPYGVRRLERDTARDVVARFSTTIPAMIVVTGLVRQALDARYPTGLR